MDPLSITAGVIAILQATGATGKLLHTLLSLRDAPRALEQLAYDAQVLRGK